MNWLIVVPCWGESYRKNFLRRGLPAVREALKFCAGAKYRFLIMTDKPSDFVEHILGAEFMVVPPGANSAEKLGNAVRIGIKHAHRGEAILLHNSDMVLSREAFLSCEQRFHHGKRFITCHSVRTDNAFDPPAGFPAKPLLEMAWARRHRWVNDCIYGKGHVSGPAIVIFAPQGGSDVVVHCFSMQCLAVYKTREIVFTGPTADELVDCFSWDEVHIVRSNDELACIEPSADDIPYDTCRYAIDHKRITRWLPAYASSNMMWQFGHQIVIKGRNLGYAQAIVDGILAKANRNLVPARLMLDSHGRLEHWKKYGWYGRLMRIPRPLRRMVPKSIRNEVLQWIGMGSV